MESIDEQFTPNQRRAIQALIDGAVAKSQQTMAAHAKHLYGDRLYNVEQGLDALTKEVRELAGLVRSLLPPQAAGGSGSERHAVSHIAKKADSQPVHIMPQSGSAPDSSPISSVDLALPRAA